MWTDGSGRRGWGHTLTTLRAWSRPPGDGRIDVRRGDKPYERLVSDLSRPACHETAPLAGMAADAQEEST